MAFAREEMVVPVGIEDISTELFDPDPAGTEAQQATVSIQVRMSDGQILVREYNLVDHVSAQTISQLIALAALIRDKANNEILPTQP